MSTLACPPQSALDALQRKYGGLQSGRAVPGVSRRTSPAGCSVPHAVQTSSSYRARTLSPRRPEVARCAGMLEGVSVVAYEGAGALPLAQLGTISVRGPQQLIVQLYDGSVRPRRTSFGTKREEGGAREGARERGREEEGERGRERARARHSGHVHRRVIRDCICCFQVGNKVVDAIAAAGVQCTALVHQTAVACPPPVTILAGQARVAVNRARRHSFHDARLHVRLTDLDLSPHTEGNDKTIVVPVPRCAGAPVDCRKAVVLLTSPGPCFWRRHVLSWPLACD